MTADSAVLASYFGSEESAVLRRYPNVPEELARRMAVQEAAPETLRSARAIAGVDYAGGFIDTASGNLVILVVGGLAKHPGLKSLTEGGEVTIEEATYRRTDLQSYLSAVQRFHENAARSGRSPIRLMGIDDQQNAVMVGVISGTEGELNSTDLGVPDAAIRIVSMLAIARGVTVKLRTGGSSRTKAQQASLFGTGRWREAWTSVAPG
jgi:hypothetical protein